MTGNKKPLVSVIMPYYNGRGFMLEALQSVIDQTYPDVEIVVVDDASPNNEDSEYIEKLSKEFGFQLLRHPINKGIAQTMADAFEASCGEFIAELSQDDLYKPQKIEKQVKELTAKDLDAVYAAGDILHPDTGKIEKRDTTKTSKIIRSGTASEALRLQNLACISIQGLLAKRSVFEKDIVPVWRDFLLDDWPVNVRLFEKYRVGFIEEALWTSRLHTTHTSMNIWKWLGPQIEVVARMSPEHIKTEAIGNRLVSMARRLQNQRSQTQDVMRFALAGLMLVESSGQYKRAAKVLGKISLKERRMLVKSKQQLLEVVQNSFASKEKILETVTTNLESLGKDIANIIDTYHGQERLENLGETFFSLAKYILQENRLISNAVKTGLASLMFVDNPQVEKQIVDFLQTVPDEHKNSIIVEKRRVLQMHGRPGLKSLFSHRGCL